MSRTFRLKEYINGKPVYTKYESKEFKYHMFKHEHPKERRHFNRSKRMQIKQYFRKYGEVQNIGNTNGWLTW